MLSAVGGRSGSASPVRQSIAPADDDAVAVVTRSSSIDVDAASVQRLLRQFTRRLITAETDRVST